MFEDSKNTSAEIKSSDFPEISKEAKEDDTGLLKLQLLMDSDIPEISIDVSKLDITNEDKTETEEMLKANETNTSIVNNITTNSNTTSPSNLVNTLNNDDCLNAKSKLNYVWVSNVQRGIKAVELKKFFSQIGKVNAVKILTNGKNLYGYVSMETAELATKCISDLNGSLFQGEKITVSRRRPDLVNENKDNAKKTDNKNEKDNSEDATKTISKNESEVTENKSAPKKISDKHIEPRSKSIDKKIEDQKKQMQNKIDSLSYTNKKLKRRLDELQRQYDDMHKKYNDLNKELKSVKFENREERRRLNQDKETFEKTKKIELTKIEADRIIASKELVEVKKLKETLKQKIDDVKFESKRFKRDRSPPNRIVRSPKRRMSPLSRNGGLYKADQRGDKKYRHDFSRERTPPPPNLNTDLGKKRTEANNVSSSRPAFFDQGVKSQSFDYRQNRPIQGYPTSRGGWMGNTRNMRRMDSNSDQNARFDSQAVQHPPSAIVVPPRAPHGSYYYPQW